MDIIRFRGVEDICDLNYPQMLGQHDLVIDPGTVEHCFNIPQAIRNASESVKVGGHIFHTNPLTMVNHGFWGLNPTTWMDYYQANGFRVLQMAIEKDGELSPVYPYRRFSPPPECSLYCLAQKVEEVPFTYPMQTKYKLMQG